MERTNFTEGSVCDLDIVDFGASGEGVGKCGDFVVFVQNVVPGDKARIRLFDVKRNYASGKIVKMLELSEDRAEPGCKNFGICGGCAYLHFAYESELKFKRKKVNDAINRIGGINFEIDEIVGMEEPYYYRNKAIYHVANYNGDIQIGFYGAKSKRISDVNGCLMFSEANERIIAAFKQYMLESGVLPYDYRTKKGLIKALMIRKSAHTNEILVCLIAASKKLPNTAGLVYMLTQSLSDLNSGEYISGISLNVSSSKNREVMGRENKFVWGEQFITDKIGDLIFRISASSFFQVNSKMTEPLYEKVSQYASLSKKQTAIDAYCGTGTISLTLAKHAGKIIGIEIDSHSAGDAVKNAELNSIENVEFINGDAGRVFDKLYKDDISAEVIVLDPPRGGCDKNVIDGIRKLLPSRIVYISCDPATLARDLKAICNMSEVSGYEVIDGCCFDMFGRSAHVETVVLIEQRDA